MTLRPPFVAGLAAAGTAAAVRVLRALHPGGRATWERRNFAGRTVTLTGGAATALGAAGACALAAVGAPARTRRVAVAGAVAVTAGGLSGLYDDLGEARQRRDGEERAPKGLRGHLGALTEGRLTTGAAKILGIGAGALAAALLVDGSGGDDAPGRTGPRRLAEVGTSTVLVAGSANLLNLLDLRPGRALKAVLLLTAPVLVTATATATVRDAQGEPRGARVLARGSAVPADAVAGAAGAALPADLSERTMLGDTGANALGAGAGVALAAALPLPARAVAAAAAVALTLASERVSFSAVIARTPALAALDGWGRRR